MSLSPFPLPWLTSIAHVDQPSFRANSALHGLTLLAFIAATTLLIVVRRRLKQSGRGRTQDLALGVGGLAVWVAYKVWGFLPANFSYEYSLPAQLCDFTSLIAPLVLITSARPLRAILYFCGIGLSSMGLFTPDLHQGPAYAKFWLFWLSHASIVGTAVYDIAARGYRPTWRDYVVAAAFATVYVALALGIDLATGFSYGYVGPSRPGQPPILDAIGPWPARVPIIYALAAAVMALLQLPWALAARRARVADPTVTTGAPPDPLRGPV